METKLKAMKVYEKELKQFPHPRSVNGITTKGFLRGMEVHLHYAEAFMLYREVII